MVILYQQVVFMCEFYINCIHIHDIYVHRLMQVNVDTCLGGVNSYENCIKILHYHKGSPNGHYIKTNGLHVCIIYQLHTNVWYYNYIYLCRSLYTHVPQVVIEVKNIYIDFFIVKVHQRIILYKNCLSMWVLKLLRKNTWCSNSHLYIMSSEIISKTQ